MKSDINIAQQKGQAQVNKTKWRTNTAQPKGPAHVNKPNPKFQPRQPKAKDWTS